MMSKTEGVKPRNEIQVLMLINIVFVTFSILTIYVGVWVEDSVSSSSSYHDFVSNAIRFCIKYGVWVFLALSVLMIIEGMSLSKAFGCEVYEEKALKCFAVLSVASILAFVLFIPWILLGVFLL